MREWRSDWSRRASADRVALPAMGGLLTDLMLSGVYFSCIHSVDQGR
jgi:hypothetical protein